MKFSELKVGDQFSTNFAKLVKVTSHTAVVLDSSVLKAGSIERITDETKLIHVRSYSLDNMFDLIQTQPFADFYNGVFANWISKKDPLLTEEFVKNKFRELLKSAFCKNV